MSYFELAQRELRRAKRFQEKNADILAAISYRNFKIALNRWQSTLPPEPESTTKARRYPC